MQSKIELIRKQAIDISKPEIYILKHLMSNCKFHNDVISTGSTLVNFSTDDNGKLVVNDDAADLSINGLVYKLEAKKDDYNSHFDSLCIFKRHNTYTNDWGFFLYSTKTRQTSDDFYVDDTLYNIPIKLKKMLYARRYCRICADSIRRYNDLNKCRQQTN
jgi:hypothetical protein